MFIFYFIIIFICICSNKCQELDTSNKTVFEDLKGWSSVARHDVYDDRNVSRIFVSCNGCRHIFEGLKMDIYFNERVDLFYWNPNHHGFDKEIYYTYVTLYHKYKFVKDDKVFSTDMGVRFDITAEFPEKTVESFYVNEELVFGKSLNSLYEKKKSFSDANYSPCKLSIIKTSFDSSKSETNIILQYMSEKKIRGITLGLKFQNDVGEVRSPDFFISRGLHNLWILKDFGYLLEADQTVEINISITSNELIENPELLTFILSDDIVCGNFTSDDLSDFESGLSNPVLSETDVILSIQDPTENINVKTSVITEETKVSEPTESSNVITSAINTENDAINDICSNNNNNDSNNNGIFDDNNIILIVLISLVIIFGIYSIASTYLLMRWKGLVHSSTKRTSSRSSDTCNSFSNFVAAREYSKFSDYELPPSYKLTSGYELPSGPELPPCSKLPPSSDLPPHIVLPFVPQNKEALSHPKVH